MNSILQSYVGVNTGKDMAPRCVVVKASPGLLVELDVPNDIFAQGLLASIKNNVVNVVVVDEEKDELVRMLRTVTDRLKQIDAAMIKATNSTRDYEMGEVIRAEALLAKVQA